MLTVAFEETVFCLFISTVLGDVYLLVTSCSLVLPDIIS